MARVLIELAQYCTSAAPRTPSRSPVECLIEAETASAASHCPAGLLTWIDPPVTPPDIMVDARYGVIVGRD